MTIVYAILMFAVLIFVHELGHFVAAKACKVKVNDFAIGMGPSVYKKTKGDTTYHIKAFPIGGFCAMEGEDEESDDEGAFNNKNMWQKALIIVAGAFMNLITALVLIIMVIYMVGTPSTTIDKTIAGSPAERAGILPGDRVISVENTKVKDWDDLTGLINDKGKKGRSFSITVNRNSKPVTVKTHAEISKDGRALIGIYPKKERSLSTALIRGPKATWNMARNMYGILKQLITGKVAAKEMSGPVGIVYFVDKSVEQGFVSFLSLMALISLNLAVFNMLPFPALDGGRLLFIIIRRFTGGVISDKAEGIVHAVGMILLLTLTVYVTWNDVIRFILPIFK